MRAFACALALSVAAVGGAADAAIPRRVASLNLCTDELLLLIATPEQIVSVTHLSKQAQESALWREASRFRTNDGTLLSMAGLRPDLILTMGGGPRDRARIASRLGLRILDLPFPQSIADVRSSIAKVADALGQKDRGRRLDALIGTLVTTRPRRLLDSIWIGGGGRSLAPTGLGAEWMALAGLRQRALPGDRVELEELLARPPRLLVRSDYRAGQYSTQQQWLAHPLARGLRAGKVVTTDGRPWTCMGPLMVGEIARLRRLAR